MSRKLTEEDFKWAADELGAEVAAIKAVCEVEAPKGGFLSDGRPTILFERHKFSKYSGGKFDKAHPDISSKKRGGYIGGAGEWKRMDKAVSLDREAAYMSASWGKFQIMGFNFAACGFINVIGFVTAMSESEGAQLKAFVALIKNWRLDDELRNHKWAAFAQAYNGAAYADNHYDTKLAAAYKKYKGQPIQVVAATNDIQQPEITTSPLPVDNVPPLPEEAAPSQQADAGSAAAQVNVNTGTSATPVALTDPNAPPIEASKNSEKSIWTTITTALGAIPAAIYGFLQGNAEVIKWALIIGGGIAALLIIRWIVTDAIRMIVASSQTRHNVK